jgi:hypothetical protein
MSKVVKALTKLYTLDPATHYVTLHLPTSASDAMEVEGEGGGVGREVGAGETCQALGLGEERRLLYKIHTL